MRAWITMILAFTFLTILGQDHAPKTLGIGFAVATNPYKWGDDSHYDHFYSDKNLKTKFINGGTNKINPFFYKPDYGLYHFICLVKTPDYYKVLVNDTTIAYLANDTNFHFTTWETILLSSTVERLTKNNPIREKSTNESEIIKSDCKPDRLKVEDIIEKKNEYWIFVSYSTTCELDDGDKTTIKHGWIKWRTKDKLLVNILLLC